jgi:hypothetical protein
MDNDSAEKLMHDGMIKFGKMVTRASVIIEGTIYSVDETNFTCVVTVATVNIDGSDTETNVLNVPLKVLRGSQASFIEIPKVGSDCTLCYRDNNIGRPQLYQVDQCDKILVKIGDSTLQIDANGFVFNGGENDGMVLLQGLLTKINRLEDKLKSHQHGYIPYPGGSPATPVSTTPATSLTPPDNTLNFTDTVQSDLENTKIKQ